jgi:hypothetical protein
MRGFAIILLGTASLPGVQAAPVLAAQIRADPDETIVTGENRVVCRRATRTATRMRTGRICRPLSEWRGQSGTRIGERSHDDMEEAANTLDGLRADDESTGCGGGLSPAPQGPLGPR